MGGEGAGSGPSEMELEPGTCGIVRRIPLPEIPFGHRVLGRKGHERDRPAFVRRLDGGFVVGPWAPSDLQDWHIDWLFVSDDGTEHVRYSVAPTATGWPLALYPMKGLLNLTWVDGSGSASTTYFGGLLLKGAKEYSITGPILENALGTTHTWPHTGVSLDGERGLLVVGNTTQKVATFSKDGSPVGTEQELELGGDCPRHIATEHGSAFLDGHRLVEFAASGEVLLDYEIEDVRSSTCPEAALTEEGFGIVSYHNDNLWRVHRLAQSGDARVDELAPTTGLGTPLALAFLGDSLLVVRSEEGGLLQRVEDGQVTPFPLPAARRARPVPSEPGRLFLDLESSQESDSVAREIIEIGCEPDQ